MREYDFSNAEQGTHYKRYRAGVSVRVTDGEVEEMGEGAAVISLDPDVLRVFPDSEAVNKALRMLIETSARATDVAKQEHAEAVSAAS